MGGLIVQTEQATKLLDKILRKYASQVSAEWGCSEDNGHTLVTLRISDWSGAKSTAFDARQLEQPDQLRYRLLRLWGDLLEVRNEKQLQELIGTGGEGK